MYSREQLINGLIFFLEKNKIPYSNPKGVSGTFLIKKKIVCIPASTKLYFKGREKRYTFRSPEGMYKFIFDVINGNFKEKPKHKKKKKSVSTTTSTRFDSMERNRRKY